MPLGFDQVRQADGISDQRQAGVAVTRLDLTQFRNYAEARLDAATGLVVLVGPNGAGKTNLLEALSFLAPGRGLRRARLTEIDRRAADTVPGQPWAVAARLDTAQGPVAIGTGREAKEGGDRRVVRVDGEKAAGQVALARHLNLVWLTPQMDRLFQEGAAPRRRFLDRLVFGFDPDHAQRLIAYETAQKERLRLLQRGGADPDWLGLIEATMAREGAALAAARRDVTARLHEAAAEAGGHAPFPRPLLALGGPAEAALAGLAADEAEALLAKNFRGSRRLDAEAGVTTAGPHRADLTVRHGGHDRPAPDCSTGEQKALLTAIVLAHARLQAELRGAAPVLLLDEVAAHLDQVRREALFDMLVGLGGQAWLTGTDADLFRPLGGRAQLVHVADGAFRPAG